jgi:hypothetical protein
MRFATGFVSTDHFQYPLAQFRGRNWRIRFGPQSKGSSITTAEIGNRVIPSKEVFIIANSESVARRVASSVVEAMTLLEGSTVPNFSHSFPWQHDPAPNTKRLHAEQWSNRGFPVACRIAVRASHRLRLQYALAKFKLSCENSSFDWIDLDPDQSRTIPRWHRAEDHLRLATAIVLAYAVLEELGLEVRASRDTPSSIGGQWNPPVKQELEDRLKRAGIDLSDPVVWSVRGGKSRLEAARPKHLYATSTRTPWTRWNIRDRLVEVVDAIGHASFLRSTISSHRLKPRLVRMLSAYDVANVQHLARRLILEKLGYWHPAKLLKKKYQGEFSMTVTSRDAEA